MSWKPDLGSAWLKARRAWFRPHPHERQGALATRQADLVAIAALQRVALAESYAGIQASSVWLETGLSVVRSLRAHPQVVLLSLMAASMSFGNKVSRARSWTLRGLALHQLYRVVGLDVPRLLRRKPDEDPAVH